MHNAPIYRSKLFSSCVWMRKYTNLPNTSIQPAFSEKYNFFLQNYKKCPLGGTIETKFPERTSQKNALLYTFSYFIVQFTLFWDKGPHKTVLNFFFHFWPKKWPLGRSKMTKNKKIRIIPIKPHKMLILII